MRGYMVIAVINQFFFNLLVISALLFTCESHMIVVGNRNMVFQESGISSSPLGEILLEQTFIRFERGDL